MPFGKKSSVTIVNKAGETSKDWLGAEAPVNETGLTPAPRISRQSLIINRDDLPPPRLCELATLFSQMRYRAGSLGEREQVRAALALQLNFLQHIFTILKQHGRADRKSEGRTIKEEVECWLLAFRSFEVNLSL